MDFSDAPDNIQIYPFVDQVAVLKEADAFISHCGMKSASESLYFGVPLVMFPQTTEQGGVANRVEELGAGIRLRTTTPASIREAVDEVMGSKKYYEKSKEIGDSLRTGTGAMGAADAIEKKIGMRD